MNRLSVKLERSEDSFQVRGSWYLGTGELEYLECCFGRRESAEIGFPCMSQQDPSSSYSTRLAAFTSTPLSTRREVLPRHTDLRATSWANHHKTDYYAKSGLIDFWAHFQRYSAFAGCCLPARQMGTIPALPCGGVVVPCTVHICPGGAHLPPHSSCCCSHCCSCWCLRSLPHLPRSHRSRCE